MVYFPARQRPYLIFSASSAQRLNGEISEFLFTTEAQRGVAATKAAILISPQRHSPCGIAARYSTGQEFAELGVFLNQECSSPRPPCLRGEISEFLFPQRHRVHRGFLHHDFLIRFSRRPQRLGGEVSSMQRRRDSA